MKYPFSPASGTFTGQQRLSPAGGIQRQTLGASRVPGSLGTSGFPDDDDRAALPSDSWPDFRPLNGQLGAKSEQRFGGASDCARRPGSCVVLAGRHLPTASDLASVGNSGIIPEDVKAFIGFAWRRRLIILVRFTNLKSARWIKRRFPAKPMELEKSIATTDDTGLVIAIDVNAVRNEGFYVVDANHFARNNGDRKLDLRSPQTWRVDQGQVIDFRTRRPFTADYDLQGIIDPENPRGHQTAPSRGNGKKSEDIMSQAEEEIIRVLNGDIGDRRIMHGPQDRWAKPLSGAMAFFPDRSVGFLPDAASVEAFYDEIGRPYVL